VSDDAQTIREALTREWPTDRDEENLAALDRLVRERVEAREALREKIRNALYFLDNDPEAARLELLAAQRALADRETT
jgi:hypothetical protein